MISFRKIDAKQLGSKYLPQTIAQRKTIIPSGPYLLKTFKEVLDEEGIPRIRRQDIINYKIKNLLEAYLFNLWSEMYPNLSKDYQCLIQRHLYSIKYN